MTVKLAGVRRAILAGITTVVVLSMSGPAYAGDGMSATSEPPPHEISLDVLTVNGSGCPAGTASVREEPDRTGFRITYRDFVAEAGGSAGPTEFRKNCQVAVLIRIPQGFTFAIARADYRGRARLQHGASALQRTNYYFQGSSANAPVEHTFSGPMNSLWHTVDITAVAALVFPPCGASRILNINAELRVDEGTMAPRSVSSMSMRSSEGEVDTLFQFHWRRC